MDISNLPKDLDGLIDSLMTAISHGEGHNGNAFNNGQGCKGSKFGYHSYVDGRKDMNIVGMTTRQVLNQYRVHPQGGGKLYDSSASYDGGANVDCSKRLFAIGRWQMIPKTLYAVAKKHNAFDTILTEEVQRKLVKDALIVNSYRPEVRDFISGKNLDIRNAQYGLALIWASITDPKTGGSHYGNGNKANAESTRQVLAVLTAIKQYYANNPKK